MATEIRQLDEVWTADGKELGIARQLFHRIDDADPALQLYATYLGVEDLELGKNFYVPLEFVADRKAETRRIDLTKKFDEAMQLTWYRMPGFVAQGAYRREELPK